MHRMIERLKHEMHKHITYKYIFQIYNAFRHLNNYNYAYRKRIKNGSNDHTNLDDLNLIYCIRKWLVIKNTNIISDNTINHILIGNNSSCMPEAYY